MTTHYSILSAQIRPEIQEKISVGFLLAGKGKVFFNFSKNKLSAAKGLLSDSAYKLLKESIKNIETTAIIENSKSSSQLLISDSLKKNSFSIDYINYLSRYNNNLLSFSAPKKIDISATDETFLKLFKQFVDETENVPATIKGDNIESFMSTNRTELMKHFNIDKEFTSSDIPNLIAPVKVDLLGRNEIPVYIQTVDLERNVYHIENELAQLAFLNLAFQEGNQKAQGFVLTREPDKSEFKQHNIWNQLRSSKQFEYIDLSESDKVLTYAKQHGVKPLLADQADPF